MREVRIHGRAGAGAITTARLLASAAFEEGKFAFAFPFFGNDRGGTPVTTFVRLDTQPVKEKSPIATPDYVLVQDPTLLQEVEVGAGIKPGGMLILNTPLSALEVKVKTAGILVVLPASLIAQETLGRSDWTGTIILGAFAAATEEIEVDALKKAISKRFSGEAAQKNNLALERGYEYIIRTCGKRPKGSKGTA